MTALRHVIVWIGFLALMAVFALLWGHPVATAATFAVIGMLFRPLIEQSVKPVERVVDAFGSAVIFVVLLPLVMLHAGLVALAYGRLGDGAWTAIAVPQNDERVGPRRVIHVKPEA